MRDDYVPTGYRPYGVKTRAVKGHEFGLGLSGEDRRALIAFQDTVKITLLHILHSAIRKQARSRR